MSSVVLSRAARPVRPGRVGCRIRNTCLLLWLISATGGTLVLVDYSTAPAFPLAAADHWPEAAGFQPDPQRLTLIMFLHPRCPCTRASIRELARTLSVSGRDPRVLAVVYCPDGAPSEWAHTDLWSGMRQLVSQPPLIDRGGRVTRQFGARISGEVMLYSPRGRLRFQGGITSGRGHEGGNPGSVALQRLLDGETLPSTRLPAFGCAITESGEGDR